MGTKQSKKHIPSWKGCIIFGIINIGCVLLCTKLGITLISTSLILSLIIGLIISIEGIIADWKKGLKTSSLGCCIGLVIQLLAMKLYVSDILMSLLNI